MFLLSPACLDSFHILNKIQYKHSKHNGQRLISTCTYIWWMIRRYNIHLEDALTYIPRVWNWLFIKSISLKFWMNLFLCVGVLDNFVQLGLVESRITMRMIGIVDCDNELDNGSAECSIAFCHRVCLIAHLVSCVGNMLQGMFESNFSQTLSPLSLMYQDVCRALSPVCIILMSHEATLFKRTHFFSFSPPD